MAQGPEGWADVSFHGSPQIPTPNLDALASTGVVLNNYYVMPLCSPSRGALMSGRYCIHIGFQHCVLLPAQPGGLPLELTIMPQHFRDLGYETHMIGKWHLGYSTEQYMPTNRGFNSFLGLHTGPEDYYSHILRWGDNEGLDFWSGTEPLTTKNGTYSTTLFTDRAKSIIRNRDNSKPLFLYLAHQATHAGIEPYLLEAPTENVAKFPYINDMERTHYAGALDAVDQSVAEVLQELEAASMLENTVIVFSSDNGGAPQNNSLSNCANNSPLRGSKGSLWEGGVRVAAFLWSADLLPHRRVSHQLMHITDWLPTLYSAAGGDVTSLGELDGFDMWSALNVGKPSPRTEILLNIDQQGGRLHCAPKISTAAVLTRLYEQEDVFKNVGRWREEATLTCDDDVNKNFESGETYYLFDVARDPCEQRNLAKDQPELLFALLDKLSVYNKTVVPPVNDTIDPRGYPQYNDGIWKPWL
ncbi:arylsulfatase B-like [Dermacentor silvarum]|uniref:arylsulfatase B-like n=1 Tax=Dermacentor silvarum TaxID=543639 RepID=UPI002100A839|nr:arylsulfatase B-like [Dermacentor silvarum]